MSWTLMSSHENNDVRLESVPAGKAGQRLDNFLVSRLKGVPRSMIYRLIRTGQVRINGKRCKPASRLDAGDKVRIPPARVAQREDAVIPDRALEQLKHRVLYRDQEVLVIDKPSGMAVHGGSGLPWGVIDVVRRLFPGDELELAHRLDRETSGCLLLARGGAALNHFSALFRDGQVEKRYLCLLQGRLPEAVVEVDAPLRRVAPEGRDRVMAVMPDGKPARTRFRLLDSWPDASYVEAELLTGRTHQIRVHALHLGMPLAGDTKYASKASCKRWRALGLKRIFLHAHALRLERPGGGSLDVQAPLPDTLRVVLDSLERGDFLQPD
jgi:23S rRNA pseudouridine955/2504/2580 synthase